MFGKGHCGPGPFGGFGGAAEGFGKGGGHCGPGHFLSDLNLTDEQLFGIAELKGKAFGKIARGKLDLMELKKEAFKELLQPQPDKAKVKAIADQIKARKSEFIDQLSDNLIALSGLLTAEQKATLRLKLVKKFLHVAELDDAEI